MKRLVATLLFLALTAASLSAERLGMGTKDATGDAAWLLHVNFDAVRDNATVAQLWAQFPQKAPALARLQEKTGFDVRKHLSDVTAFGTGKRGEGVIIFRHTFDNSALEKALGEVVPNAIAKRTDKGPVLYKISTRHGSSAPESEYLLAFSRKGVVVMACDETQMAGGISIADIYECMPSGPRSTEAVYFRADIEAMAKQRETVPHWAKQLRYVRLGGVMNGDIFGITARVTAVNEATAQTLAKLVEEFAKTRYPSIELTVTHDAAPNSSDLIISTKIPLKNLFPSASAPLAHAGK